MKEATRRRLSELILEELSEKIRKQESLRFKLEAFADLPVEKVAEAILKQFEYLLSSDLRDLIIHLVQREVEAEEAAARAAEEEPIAHEPAKAPAEEPASIIPEHPLPSPVPSVEPALEEPAVL